MGVRALYTRRRAWMPSSADRCDRQQHGEHQHHGFRRDGRTSPTCSTGGGHDRLQRAQRHRPALGIEIGNGVRLLSTQKIFSSGGMDKTGGELDLASPGTTTSSSASSAPAASGLTRNGNFTAMRRDMVNGGRPPRPGDQHPRRHEGGHDRRERRVTPSTASSRREPTRARSRCPAS